MPHVVPWRPELRDAFERLNREWIERWFEVEDADREAFRDPGATIVAPGGQILFVVENGEPLGTCAVVRHDDETYEIAKMAVAPEARGRHYGDLLMDAAIGLARERGARRLVIVSNTRLAPAIRLYEKHGFVRVPMERDDRYARADIRLELALEGNRVR
ncbi:MAG TPA: GNAT family N-acetyltransferase [Gemmatimonadales bacterium]